MQVNADEIGYIAPKLDLKVLFLIFYKERLVVLGCVVLVIISSLLWFKFTAPSYTARAIFLPPQQQGGVAALANLGAGGALAGMVAGVKTPDELYVGLLKTTSVQDEIIEKYKLEDRFDSKTLEDARSTLSKSVLISSDKKSGLITVAAEDVDPKFAAVLANSHLDVLRKNVARLAITEAQQRRLFFEEQLKKAREKAFEYEKSLFAKQRQNGVVSIDSLTQGSVVVAAELKSLIAQKQIQMQVLGRFATGRNVDVQRVAAEIAALEQKLRAIESGSPGGAAVGVTAAIDTLREYRELKYQEAVIDALVKQLEIAKLDESKEGNQIQIVDLAKAPQKSNRPSLVVIEILSLTIGLALGAMYGFIKNKMLQKNRT